ncbi:hypothetical protein DFP72DRAFT_915123 [Ephemerocybe angulata]|uniref:Uncharacterized protein n=1 Tax=Ephemerocybe angulata TaxID=980116 RepID=A0A8H6LYN4_9AGAR|nr:hypothetical protein DFP72DRAFT_915123 [Tulosesus angulatus]
MVKAIKEDSAPWGQRLYASFDPAPTGTEPVAFASFLTRDGGHHPMSMKEAMSDHAVTPPNGSTPSPSSRSTSSAPSSPAPRRLRTSRSFPGVPIPSLPHHPTHYPILAQSHGHYPGNDLRADPGPFPASLRSSMAPGFLHPSSSPFSDSSSRMSIYSSSGSATSCDLNFPTNLNSEAAHWHGLSAQVSYDNPPTTAPSFDMMQTMPELMFQMPMAFSTVHGDGNGQHVTQPPMDQGDQTMGPVASGSNEGWPPYFHQQGQGTSQPLDDLPSVLVSGGLATASYQDFLPFDDPYSYRQPY